MNTELRRPEAKVEISPPSGSTARIVARRESSSSQASQLEPTEINRRRSRVPAKILGTG